MTNLELPPGRLAQVTNVLRRGDVLMRIAICAIASLLMWIGTGAWNPPFPYRIGMIPSRDIITRATFEVVDKEKTREEQERARRRIECVYDHDPGQLSALQARLRDRVVTIVSAENYDQVDRQIWNELRIQSKPPSDSATPAAMPQIEPAASQPDTNEQPPAEGAPTEDAPVLSESARQYAEFVASFSEDKDMSLFKAAVARAFEELEEQGILESIQHELEQGSQTEITVFHTAQNRLIHHVPVQAVRRPEAIARLEQRLQQELKSPVQYKYVFPWLKSQLPSTLTFDSQKTSEVAEAAAIAVGDVMATYTAGVDRLAVGGRPLTSVENALLVAEREALIQSRSPLQLIANMGGDFGMFMALYLLCGFYIFYRQHDLLRNLRRLISLQIVVVVTVITAWGVSHGWWRTEMVPLMLCAMILVIIHGQELALLIAVAVTLVTVLSLGYGMFEFVVLAGTLAATVLLLRRVRSRTKLVYVGFGAGIVATLTTLGVGTVLGVPLGLPLLTSAAWYGFCTLLASVLMTGLLPFIEQWLDVQTDMSLLELGDVAHPLLQELVRRAPGTYNHSINVASLAESAAEAIGANGLLVRVGAYFHDIGKMLKPQYFIENQSHDGNRHETLLPAMSTLIIIAHVKDGADLARQHHLPQCIVDFILQHHGTTLVEYFYDRASKQQEEDPDAGEVDEGSYRYPGPRPQTREAAVLMLADTVESASRALQDPAPARIESLVDGIAMKKLLDNQFDECGLTLQELRMVQDSLVKSLTAMYHSRIKYPGRHSA
ncbi:MAG: HDIG domain-containing protein [Planctomycetales bacterium]|nr:HDIG domain-containing protein [Planctomycetales bacterium]